MRPVFLLTASEPVLPDPTVFEQVGDTVAQSLFRGGNTTLMSLVSFALSTALIALAVTAGYRVIHRLLSGSQALSKSPQYLRFLLRLTRTVCILLGVLLVLMQFDQMRALAVSLLTGTGVVALCIGLASQEVMANMVSGAFLMLNRPFVIGDQIRIPEKDITGVVENMTLRHTVVRTFENTTMIIPNSMANTVVIENITNAARTFGALEMTVAYDADLTLARQIMARHIAEHPSFLDVRTPEQLAQDVPAVNVLVKEMGDSAITLRAAFWAPNIGAQMSMLSDLRQSVKAEFDRCGIEIPFPQRVIHVKHEKEV